MANYRRKKSNSKNDVDIAMSVIYSIAGGTALGVKKLLDNRKRKKNTMVSICRYCGKETVVSKNNCLCDKCEEFIKVSYYNRAEHYNKFYDQITKMSLSNFKPFLERLNMMYESVVEMNKFKNMLPELPKHNITTDYILNLGKEKIEEMVAKKVEKAYEAKTKRTLYNKLVKIDEELFNCSEIYPDFNIFLKPVLKELNEIILLNYCE